MRFKWKNGTYEGEAVNNVPNGIGVLELENGIQKGEWENGELVRGCQYIDDKAYVGDFGEDGSFDGKGFFAHENGRVWRGVWKNGEKVASPESDPIPNSIVINSYYGAVELESMEEKWFPTLNKVYETGYCRMTESDKYELDVLSEKFGVPVIGLVIKKNNRYNYGYHANSRAMYFMKNKNPVMYDDAYLWTKKGLHYAPFDCKTVEAIHDYIWDFLTDASENTDLGNRLGEYQRMMRACGYCVLDCGIYKGEMENGVPCGQGRLVYNHDDPEGRAFYKGYFKDGKPDGNNRFYQILYYRQDTPDGKRYYKGGFKDGLFHCESGYDTLYIKNGYAEGTWLKGKLHGAACRIGKNGEKWEGNFENGEIVRGVCEKPNYKYIGTFKNFLPHGDGMENAGDGIHWSGIFHEGKRLVGIGDEALTNAIELYNPNVIKPLEFICFDEDVFSAHMRCEDVKFVVNSKTEELSGLIGIQIALAVSEDKKNAKNSIAEKVFGVSCTGSCIVCGYDGERATPLCEELILKLSTLIAEMMTETKKGKNKGGSKFYTAVELEHKRESDWVITRETHDDYPLEGYEKFETRDKILLRVDDESYFLEYYHRSDYPYDAFDKTAEDKIESYARGKVHKIPVGMTELSEIQAYVDKHKKWSHEYETGWFMGMQERYQEKKMWIVFKNEVVSGLLGRELEMKEE